VIFNLFEFFNIFFDTFDLSCGYKILSFISSTILFVIELLEQLIEVLLFVIFAV